MANVSSSNGLEKRPKLRFPGFDEPWNTALLSDYFVKSTKKNSDGMISNVICNSAKQGLIPQREYYHRVQRFCLQPQKICRCTLRPHK